MMNRCRTKIHRQHVEIGTTISFSNVNFLVRLVGFFSFLLFNLFFQFFFRLSMDVPVVQISTQHKIFPFRPARHHVKVKISIRKRPSILFVSFRLATQSKRISASDALAAANMKLFIRGPTPTTSGVRFFFFRVDKMKKNQIFAF